MRDLEVAMRLAAITKSNSIVFVRNGVLQAIGMGMTSRVDATKSAIRKSKEQ